MALTCTRCSRTNPTAAQYCYFDGLPLAGANGAARGQAASFTTPFVFPNGQACQNFDQLARACHDNWREARELLQQGFLGSFLGGLGRVDLAQAAQQAASFPDPDRGLDQLLGRFPTQSIDAPKLRAEPAEINLGILKVGGDRKFELQVANQGMRLLFGQIVSSSDWLSLGEGAGQAQRLFQCLDSATIAVQVRGGTLRAGHQPLVGKLVIESNGGRATIKVKAEVPVQPFPTGVLAGATAPRQIAEKAKAHPKEAADLFEKGAVAQWYQDNGWTYPVQQPAASGLGAVQQFFEALGLVKVPKVEISETSIRLQGRPGERVTHLLQVSTPDKRPVFAHGASSQPWLVVGKPQLKGATAAIPIEATVPRNGAQTLNARVRVQANGNQRFDVAVTLVVGAAGKITAPRPLLAEITDDEPLAAIIDYEPLAEIIPDPVPATPLVPVKPKPTSGLKPRTNPDFDFNKPEEDRGRRPRTGGREGKPNGTAPARASTPLVERPGRRRDQPGVAVWLHALPLLLLLTLLVGASVRDLFSPNKPSNVRIDDPPEPKLVQEAKVKIEDDPDENLRIGLGGFQATIQDEPEEPGQGGPNKVKFDIQDEPEEVAPVAGKGAPIDPRLRVRYECNGVKRWGLVDALNGKKLTFASDGSTNTTVVRLNGQSEMFGGLGFDDKALGQARKLPDDPARGTKEGTAFSQLINAPGRPKGLKVTQILEIIPSKQPVDVGGQQRRLLDTLLVRYVLENQGKQTLNAGLRLEVDTLIGDNDGVPFTVPGRPGLVNRGTDFATPTQVPDFVQALETGDLRNPGTVVHISLNVGGGIEAPSRVLLCQWASNDDLSNPRPTNFDDSAIILVWPDQALKPGQKREIGYAYGLGSVTAGEGQGKLGVTLGGNFDIGQSFTITAYVNSPVPNQTLTLDLPAGLQRIKGEQVQNVQKPQVGNTSIVTWEARVQQTGVFPVKVRSSTGVTQTKIVTIARDGPAAGKMNLQIRGSNFEPGQIFEVVAIVDDPAPGQTLTLTVPPGLERQKEAEQALPPAVGGKSQLTWRVLVQRAGRYPVRVQSSTGGAQTKTINIEEADRAPGRFFFKFDGDIAPGKNFTVTARVFNPAGGQTLTLEPPAGLKITQGLPMQRVPSPGADQMAGVQWQVQVEKPGKYPVEVRSSTGRKQKKTINLSEGPGEGHFELVLQGDVKLKGVFTLLAKVAQPVAGQTLTLSLPKEMELSVGTKTQTVPGLPGGGAPSQASWTVLLNERGTRLPIRVESSTGLVRTKTLTITGGESGPGGVFR